MNKHFSLKTRFWQRDNFPHNNATPSLGLVKSINSYRLSYICRPMAFRPFSNKTLNVAICSIFIPMSCIKCFSWSARDTCHIWGSLDQYLVIGPLVVTALACVHSAEHVSLCPAHLLILRGLREERETGERSHSPFTYYSVTQPPNTAQGPFITRQPILGAVTGQK